MRYTLQTLNQAYSEAIIEDKEVNAGGLLETWNSLFHSYWTDKNVIDIIAAGLYDILQQLNRTN